MAIGIFDSGLGGLTIFDAIVRRLPEVELIYFGDNLRAPYGVRSSEEIYQYTLEGVKELWGRDCQLVILACNTASAVALRRLQEEVVPADRRVLGVFVPTIEAIVERAWGDSTSPQEVSVKRVALFATPATVASRAFQRELAFRAIGVDVESQPCGGLVDAVESGDLMMAEALARSHVDALLRRMPNPEVAVLGCTHYPLILDTFQEALGPQVRVISQPALVADSLVDYLGRHSWIDHQKASSTFLTSGDSGLVSNRATLFLCRPVRFDTL